MKIRNKFIIILLFLLPALFTSQSILAQAKSLDDYTLSFDLTCEKQTDNSRNLKVEYIGTNSEDPKDKLAVIDANVEFYNILADKEVLLGKAKTDKEGIAKFTVPANQKLLADADGLITLVARNKGKGKMEDQESEISFKDLNFDLNFTNEDDVRTLKVSAYTLKSDGTKEPVESLDLSVGVLGMLSKMVLDEGTLESGEYEFELPEDLHPKSDGNITMFAKVDEDADFGSVIKTTTIKLAKPKIIDKSELTNQLWTKAAPIWMYVVLGILLIGIWANYAYTLIKLIKIKNIGKN